MLFMRFDLGVVWVNGRGEVVDKIYAKKWRLQYTPRRGRPIRHRNAPQPPRVQIGDNIEFREK